jgi:hypothetical protein
MFGVSSWRITRPADYRLHYPSVRPAEKGHRMISTRHHGGNVIVEPAKGPPNPLLPVGRESGDTSSSNLGRGEIGSNTLHVVQFSGGAASAYVAWLVANEMGRKNTVLLFHNTKAEHPDAARFRLQVSEFVGVPITEVSDGRDLWEVIADNHCLPSNRIPFCTRILKAEPAQKYYKTLKDQGIDFVLYNGLGMEEWRRVQRSIARSIQDGHKLRCLLMERDISDKEVKRAIRDDWKICLPEPYKHLSHNNCIPCFKAGKLHFEKVARNYPAEFEKACQVEDTLGQTVFADGITLRQRKANWDQQSSFIELEEESIPCLCAI